MKPQKRRFPVPQAWEDIKKHGTREVLGLDANGIYRYYNKDGQEIVLDPREIFDPAKTYARFLTPLQGRNMLDSVLAPYIVQINKLKADLAVIAGRVDLLESFHPDDYDIDDADVAVDDIDDDDSDIDLILEEEPCVVKVTIYGDGYGDEVAWSIKDLHGEVVLSGGPYSDVKWADEKEVEITSGVHTFHVSTVGEFNDNTLEYEIRINDILFAEGDLDGGEKESVGGIRCGIYIDFDQEDSSYTDEDLDLDVDEDVCKILIHLWSFNSWGDEVSWALLPSDSDTSVLSGGPYKSFNWEDYRVHTSENPPYDFILSTMGEFGDNVVHWEIIIYNEIYPNGLIFDSGILEGRSSIHISGIDCTPGDDEEIME